MILKELTFGELAQCYFPNLIQSEAVKKLSSYIKPYVNYLEDETEREMIEKGELDSKFIISGGEVAVIGMKIGYPRDNLREDVRDTITFGFNLGYEVDHPMKRKIMLEAYKKLDCRLDPPLEFYDCKEINDES